MLKIQLSLKFAHKLWNKSLEQILDFKGNLKFVVYIFQRRLVDLLLDESTKYLFLYSEINLSFNSD